MPVIAGVVNAPDGTPQSGATVFIVDSGTDTLEAELTTDSNGEFNHDTGDSGAYHVAVQHDDGTTQYNAPSYPEIQ